VYPTADERATAQGRARAEERGNCWIWPSAASRFPMERCSCRARLSGCVTSGRETCACRSSMVQTGPISRIFCLPPLERHTGRGRAPIDVDASLTLPPIDGCFAPAFRAEGFVLEVKGRWRTSPGRTRARLLARGISRTFRRNAAPRDRAGARHVCRRPRSRRKLLVDRENKGAA